MPKIAGEGFLHCMELVTGQKATGKLLLSEDDIRVQFYNFDDFFGINASAPIYVLSEKGDIVSLHNNVGAGPGRTGAHGRTIHHQSIISNLAIAGRDRWTDQDKVRRASFTVKHSMELMRHRGKVEAMGTSAYPTSDQTTLFEANAHGMRLRAWYGASYGMDFDTPTDFWPMFEIEFDEGKGILEYIKHVSDYVHFLSFCLGATLKPSEIHVDRLSRDEAAVEIEAKTYAGSYRAHYVWPEEEIKSGDLWVGGSPVRAWDDDELGALRACLVAWMDRASLWKKSYVMMATSLALKGVVSAERLINACRWFEDIPTAQAKDALCEEDIMAISDAAAEKAKELGHDPAIRMRISSAIKRVKEESSEQHFDRLVASIRKRFGAKVLLETAVADLKRAKQFRGRTAHGHFSPKNDAEFMAFIKSIRAMEALCYLLTAADLPIAQAGLERVLYNPVVRDYLLTKDEPC